MKGADDDRALLRLLRRLSTRNAMVRKADRAALATASGRGLVAVNPDGGITLTPVGAAFLRRGLADGDGFVRQHQERVKTTLRDRDIGIQPVTVNLAESPLAWLRQHTGRDGRPMIDADQFAAGERLRADHARGQMMPRITANWTASVASGRRAGGAGAAEITEVALAARLRVEKAIVAVGPECGGLLLDFCCFLKGLEQIERERRWPPRSAKVVLGFALSSLARHYGLSSRATGGARARMVHWGTADYRPTLD